VLPDVLKPNLNVVFCGTAAGATSARVGAYYAGIGNKFWEILFQTGLTSHKFAPHEYPALPQYGLGLTDLAKMRSGADEIISPSDFDILSFCTKINQFSPKVVAFNGKKAAEVFFGCRVNYGGPSFYERIIGTAIFVLPSTSAAARRYWDYSYWRDLSDFVRKLN
jgi:TDG/mug DNA glycosylase family protein